jgi:hypothetical protein
VHTRAEHRLKGLDRPSRSRQKKMKAAALASTCTWQKIKEGNQKKGGSQG